MIQDSEIVIRLLLSAFLGMIIGFERERQNQPAGLRTHTILAIGSCLAMTMSINLAMQFKPVVSGDPARLAAQVISGLLSGGWRHPSIRHHRQRFDHSHLPVDHGNCRSGCGSRALFCRHRCHFCIITRSDTAQPPRKKGHPFLYHPARYGNGTQPTCPGK